MRALTSDKMARATGLFVMAMLVLHPLSIGPESYYNITSVKLYAFFAILSIFLARLSIIFIFRGRGGGRRRSKPSGLAGIKSGLSSLSSREYALIAVWLSLFISSLLSDSPARAFFNLSGRPESLIVVSGYLLTAFLVGRFYRPSIREISAFCVILAAVSAYGICQYYGFDFLHLNPEPIAGVTGPHLVYLSTLSNRNVASTCLCLAFCVCSALFCRLECRKSLLFLPLGLVVIYLLILGNTEGGYVGIAFSFAVFLPVIVISRRSAFRFFLLLSGCLATVALSTLFHRPSWPPSVWSGLSPLIIAASAFFMLLAVGCRVLPDFPPISLKKRLILWYLILFAVVAALTIFIYTSTSDISGSDTLTSAGRILRGDFDDSLGNYRMFVWKRSLTLFFERSVFGFGPDGFYHAFSAKYGDELTTFKLNPYDKAHNEYLHILIEGGISGLICILAWYTLAMRGIVRRCLDDPISLSLSLALSAFLVQAFFNIGTPVAHPVVWTFWGIASALGRPEKMP